VQLAAGGHRGSLLQLAVDGTGSHVVVRLTGNRTLSGVLEVAKDPPARIFLDLEGIEPKVPALTRVGRGPVHQIRVGFHSARPPASRVVLDLRAAARYRLEQGITPRELRIIVEPGEKETTTHPPAVSDPWNGLANRLDRLLHEAAFIQPSDRKGAARLFDIDRRWETLLHDLDAVTPPDRFKTGHALMVTAARLGRIAGQARRDAGELVGNASSGEAGATMLLKRARAELAGTGGTASAPGVPQHDEHSTLNRVKESRN